MSQPVRFIIKHSTSTTFQLFDGAIVTMKSKQLIE
jgi:hypothetical protein